MAQDRTRDLPFPGADTLPTELLGPVGENWNYRNDPKFSDRYAWANSADPDQTAPGGAVWSGSTLFAIPPASFGLITELYGRAT